MEKREKPTKEPQDDEKMQKRAFQEGWGQKR
jgi:hypothetical protein